MMSRKNLATFMDNWPIVRVNTFPATNVYGWYVYFFFTKPIYKINNRASYRQADFNFSWSNYLTFALANVHCDWVHTVSRKSYFFALVLVVLLMLCRIFISEIVRLVRFKTFVFTHKFNFETQKPNSYGSIQPAPLHTFYANKPT